jgi:hypothetical protein
VPWSRAPKTSFLVTFDAMKSALEPTGFKVVAWDDRTQAAVAGFAEQAEGARRCPGRRASIPTASPAGFSDARALPANCNVMMRR